MCLLAFWVRSLFCFLEIKSRQFCLKKDFDLIQSCHADGFVRSSRQITQLLWSLLALALKGQIGPEDIPVLFWISRTPKHPTTWLEGCLDMHMGGFQPQFPLPSSVSTAPLPFPHLMWGNEVCSAYFSLHMTAMNYMVQYIGEYFVQKH